MEADMDLLDIIAEALAQASPEVITRHPNGKVARITRPATRPRRVTRQPRRAEVTTVMTIYKARY
jgi:hypothetical protein